MPGWRTPESDVASCVFWFSGGLIKVRWHQQGPSGSRHEDVSMVLRWDDVISVTMNFKQIRDGDDFLYPGYVELEYYRLEASNGTTVAFGPSTKMPKGLVRAVNSAVIPGMLQQTIEWYESGADVAFGGVRIGPSGIRRRDQVIPWNDVRSIRVSDVIDVRASGGG